jgi:hypothetical protein
LKVIDPYIKTRVIELFQAKKEYKEIVQILKEEGINVSFGSCWNIVSKWKDSNRLDQGFRDSVGHSGIGVGNIYRLSTEDSTEHMVLTSGHIPVPLTIKSESLIVNMKQEHGASQQQDAIVREQQQQSDIRQSINLTKCQTQSAPSSTDGKIPAQQTQTQTLPDETFVSAQEADTKLQGLTDPDSVSSVIVAEQDIDALKTEKLELQNQVHIDRKTVEDFNSVKTEIRKYGFDILGDSKKFLDTLAVFKRFSFDVSKMVETFLKVQDIVAEKEKLEQVRQEITRERQILDEKLEQIGCGNFERLRKTVAALMTFEEFGITQEMIINLYHRGPQGLRQQQSRRAQDGWDAQYINQRNNGGGGQGQPDQGYVYS